MCVCGWCVCTWGTCVCVDVQCTVCMRGGVCVQWSFVCMRNHLDMDDAEFARLAASLFFFSFFLSFFLSFLFCFFFLDFCCCSLGASPRQIRQRSAACGDLCSTYSRTVFLITCRTVVGWRAGASKHANYPLRSTLPLAAQKRKSQKNEKSPFTTTTSSLHAPILGISVLVAWCMNFFA